MSARTDIPIIVNPFLLLDYQISMSRHRDINVFQCNRECFFLRLVKLNPRFVVVTIDAVTLDRPIIGMGFSVICRFSRLRLSRFTMKFSAESFALGGLFPSVREFSEFAVSH